MIWASILAGALSVVGAFGGVILTRRHAERLAESAHLNAERDAIRGLLTRVTSLGHGWADLTEALLPAYAVFGTEDLLGFDNTDSGKQLREVTGELGVALGEARLRLGNQELLSPFGHAYRLFQDAPETAIGPVLPTNGRSSDARLEGLLVGLRHVNAFRKAIWDLELAAAPLVGTKITHDGAEGRRSTSVGPPTGPADKTDSKGSVVVGE